jgi:CheY-like chemotaxis protein
MAGELVLVVDDDDDIREVMREILESEGYRVAEASNGREALDRLGELGQRCIVLLDLMMPVMTGWQVVEELRRSGRTTVPVIIVSATPHDAPTYYPVVKKPIALRELLKVIEKSCDAATSPSD